MYNCGKNNRESKDLMFAVNSKVPTYFNVVLFLRLGLLIYSHELLYNHAIRCNGDCETIFIY